jgi:hypothetical protein
MALTEALNKELNDLADAGCPVIQLEEPQIHMVPARGKAFGKLDAQDLVGVFNTVAQQSRPSIIIPSAPDEPQRPSCGGGCPRGALGQLKAEVSPAWIPIAMP